MKNPKPKVIRQKQIFKKESYLHLFVSVRNFVFVRSIFDFSTMSSRETRQWLQDNNIELYDKETYWDLGEYLCGRREYRVEGTVEEKAITNLFKNI